MTASLNNTGAGVCPIYLAACIAALESRIKQHRMTAQERRAEAANAAAVVLGEPLDEMERR